MSFEEIRAWFHSLSLSQLTDYYIFLLISLFLFFSGWCLTPIIVRWVQLRWIILSVYFKKKWNQKANISQKQLQKKIFRNTAWARQDFENFRLAWEEARLPGKDVAVCPIRMREFLSPETVLDGAVNQRLAEALPGIFVALGIFGTFLGLVLGLRELNFDELANLREGIGQLMSGLSLAFYTSLVGITLSVFFSLLYRGLVRRLEKAVDALDSVLVSIFPYEPDELLIRRNYEMQGDIKQSIQTMATDIATKFSETIAPALDEALTKNLLPGMLDLQKEIKENLEKSEKQQEIFLKKIGTVIVNHFENSQKKQSDAMEQVLGTYVKTMNETFQTQFQDMGRIIEETTRVQGEIRDQMVQFAERLQKQFGVQSELIDKTGDAARILNDSLQSLEGIARELKSSAEGITNAAVLLDVSAKKAMEGQDVLRETMDRQIGAMTQTRTDLEKTWEAITENANGLMEMMRELIRELAEGVGEQLNKALTVFDSKVAEVVERFSGTLFEARENIEEFPELLLKLGQSIDRVNDNVSSQKTILEGLQNTTKNLVAPNIEKALRASHDFQSTWQSFDDARHELQGWVEGSVENLRAAAVQFENTLLTSVRDLGDWSQKTSSEMETNARLLGESGPLHTALMDLGTRLSETQHVGGEPQKDPNGQNALKTELQMKNVHEILQQFSNSNKALQESLSADIHQLAGQASEISRGINTNVLETLKSISESTAGMSTTLNNLKVPNRETEPKNGFFKKMIRK
jgi:ABC-type transporter Mla subunit MlaD